MAKPSFQPNPRVRQIFDDLEHYLVFCQDFGYKFDESTLYDRRSFAFRQFEKWMTNKSPKDMWVEAIIR